MRSDIVPGGTFPDYELPDHANTLRFAAFYPKIAVAYTQIATISTDDHHTLQKFRASVGAQWTFLSGLVTYSIYNGYWFWGHPSIADLWHDLRALSGEIRPDWDLSTPGLRDWNTGDLSAFHGWSKRADAKTDRSRVKKRDDGPPINRNYSVKAY